MCIRLKIGISSLLQDQARTALEGDIFKEPLDGHQKAGRAGDQEIDMAQPPNALGQPARSVEVVEISDRTSPPYGGHHAEIAVPE